MIRKEVREEAELILLEGGEIPEVAYWNAWFFLTSPPPEGLGLRLNGKETRYLKEAVCRRYLAIIRRDLTPENIGKPHYRGLPRARINWERLRRFAQREGLWENGWHQEILEYLQGFIEGLSPGEALREEALQFLEELRREVL
ncbi:hypothetical protein FVE67_04580 [Thermosulfurimonas marina]|uniref:Uncharacterized protein n=1 Tax=Thermosulfurimonas marina TaxID=2047767 RepID=A0A6H1WSB8_9BACT|nr:hypothetical protein [Thermosulfurimonas marina]QJA06115.1 hypothetical protein FVE67_04580 [Thermosulfurimonas marina]